MDHTDTEGLPQVKTGETTQEDQQQRTKELVDKIVVKDNLPVTCRPVSSELNTTFDVTSDVPENNIYYRIALKAPHGTDFQCFHFSSGMSEKMAEEDKNNNDINRWLNSLFLEKYEHWILYNDEPPHNETEEDDTKSTPFTPSSSHAHAKGVLAWNRDHICWLIHSTPKFPRKWNGGKFEPLAHAECVYGQSYFFIEKISITLLQGILRQLQIMNPWIYETNYLLLTQKKKLHVHLPLVEQIHLGGGLYHISKSGKWNQDIYGYLHSTFKGQWKCETWVRGHHCGQSPYMCDIKRVKWLKEIRTVTRLSRTEVVTTKNVVIKSHAMIHSRTSSVNITYESSQDHSKYAVNDLGYVFFGDNNRMTSQFHRGGGGVVFLNPHLNGYLESILHM
jgi:hypothetical protein